MEKNNLIKLMLVFCTIFLLVGISAEAISDQLHVNIQVTDEEGTYTYQAYLKDTNEKMNSTEQRTITISEMCSPIINIDGIITDAQICEAVNTHMGTGKIKIGQGGTLTLIGSSNITTAGLNISREGDSIFIKTDSKLRIV